MATPPAAVEALLFAAGEPVRRSDLCKLLDLKEVQLQAVLSALRTELQGRGIALIETEGDVELRTAPDAADIVKKYRENELSRDLGKASLETLAVIAYQDGATRGEVDWVRGVNSTASIRTLLLRGLIEGCEDPSDRRRHRYTLTTEALAHLGMQNAADLPRREELRRGATEAITQAAAQSASAPDVTA